VRLQLLIIFFFSRASLYWRKKRKTDPVQNPKWQGKEEKKNTPAHITRVSQARNTNELLII
jgi:hypothetical protein